MTGVSGGRQLFTSVFVESDFFLNSFSLHHHFEQQNQIAGTQEFHAVIKEKKMTSEI